MKKINQYPTAVGGLCLGIAGISSFWSMMVVDKKLSEGILMLGFVIALSLLIPIAVKFCCYPALFREEIKHPTVGSIIPTSVMALMLLSHSLALVSAVLPVIIWCLAVIAHLVFLTLFIYHRVKDFDLNHIVPSWFVPPIGIVVACLTVPATFLLPIAYILLVFGLLSYAILLPVVLYRLSLGEKIEDTRKPSLAVLAAPASLTLSGYLTLVNHPSPLLVLFLFSIAIVMTVSVYLMLFHLLRIPFTPACTAFTFPLAISATAMYKGSLWFYSQDLFHVNASYFHALSLLEGVIATIVIIYILQHILRFVARL